MAIQVNVKTLFFSGTVQFQVSQRDLSCSSVVKRCAMHTLS